MSRDCRCGHSRTAHQHLRPGTDCALCWPNCTAYRPRRIVGRLS